MEPRAFQPRGHFRIVDAVCVTPQYVYFGGLAPPGGTGLGPLPVSHIASVDGANVVGAPRIKRILFLEPFARISFIRVRWPIVIYKSYNLR